MLGTTVKALYKSTSFTL